MRPASAFSLSAICVILVVMTGCQTPKMDGPYNLFKNGCIAPAIRSSRLVLKPNGIYSQHHELESGETIDVDGQRWSYSSGTIRLEGFRIDGKVGRTAGTEVTVKADPQHPHVIALPGSTCYYSGPK